MNLTDLIVVILYLLGLVVMGGIFYRRNKSANDMFAAGGQSPWWVSGLSSFMTMFSAGTFVVWGGIAYRFGMVAVVISMCYGVAAMIVGWTIAGRWKALGVSSAAEFIQLRYGKSLVQFYTWFQGLLMLFSLGGAVYALAVVVCALIPLPEGHLLADPATGHLSVTFVSVFICLVVITITLVGGLWAVLMTDVLQFIILTVSVVFVVPLILWKAGGMGDFVQQAPEGFFSPVASDFTWWFMLGWVVVHFFKIGGEWAYIQRFVCVPSRKDARKSAYLFGIMYLVSPLLWMIPPMVYRVLNPDANYEQAYILACQAVLPAGMIGLMIASMSSATASMVTTQLNVFAGAFTTEFYHRWLNPQASERQVVFVGRLITLVLGMLIISGAILIPLLGTYTGFILAFTAIVTGPLVLPTIWGAFSHKVGLRTAWCTTVLGITAGVLVKFGFQSDGFLSGFDMFAAATYWVQANARVAELLVGTVVPLSILGSVELFGRRPEKDPLDAFRAGIQKSESTAPVQASPLPAILSAWTVGSIAVVMGVLAIIDREERWVLLGFAGVLASIGVAIIVVIRRTARVSLTP